MTAAKKLRKNKPPAVAAPVPVPRGIKLPGDAATVSQVPGEKAVISSAEGRWCTPNGQRHGRLPFHFFFLGT